MSWSEGFVMEKKIDASLIDSLEIAFWLLCDSCESNQMCKI